MTTLTCVACGKPLGCSCTQEDRDKVMDVIEASQAHLIECRIQNGTINFGRRGRPAYDDGNPAKKKKHTFNMTDEDWQKWNGIVEKFAKRAGWDHDRSDSRTFRSIIDLLDLDYSWMDNFEFAPEQQV